MARKKDYSKLTYARRQKILYIDRTPKGKLLEIAEGLLEMDRFSEAFDFISRSGDEKKLEEYMYGALERGDFFNFDRAARKLDMEVPTETWKQLGDNAAEAGFINNAVEAYRRAGQRGRAREIMDEHPEFFEPVVETERQKALAAGKSAEQDEEAEQPAEEDTGQQAAAGGQPKASKKKKKKKRKKK